MNANAVARYCLCHENYAANGDVTGIVMARSTRYCVIGKQSYAVVGMLREALLPCRFKLRERYAMRLRYEAAYAGKKQKI